MPDIEFPYCNECGAEIRPGQHFIVNITEPESFDNWRETWEPAPGDGAYHVDCALAEAAKGGS